MPPAHPWPGHAHWTRSVLGDGSLPAGFVCRHQTGRAGSAGRYEAVMGVMTRHAWIVGSLSLENSRNGVPRVEFKIITEVLRVAGSLFSFFLSLYLSCAGLPFCVDSYLSMTASRIKSKMAICLR